MSIKDLNQARWIETGRLSIRPCTLDDVPVWRRAIDENFEHLKPWIPFMKDEPRDQLQTMAFLRQRIIDFEEGSRMFYLVFDKESDALIGDTGLMQRVGPDAMEIGYWLDGGSTRKGYAREMVAAMVRLAFDGYQMRRLEIHCDPENLLSNRVAELLGFDCEARLKQRFQNHLGQWCDLNIWSMFAEDYRQSDLPRQPVNAVDATGEKLF